MLSPTEIRDLAVNLESHRVERKRSYADVERVREAVCAFANDLPGEGVPGVVLIGLNDDGSHPGLPVTDELLLKLGDLRSDGNISPMPSLQVYRVELSPGAAVAVVEVEPASAPPVRVRGRTWVRIGPRRGLATPDEERRLSERRVANTRSFDAEPCLGSSSEDLDLDAFRNTYLPAVVAADVLAENQRSLYTQLASLRMFDDATASPTHAGLLALGREPLRWMPGAYLQYVRVDGTDKADPVVDHRELRGNLLQLKLHLELLLPSQIRIARVPDEGLRHKDVPDYPVAAVREAVLNAMMHRAYTATNAPILLYWFIDRVEVLSPGGLYGRVTAENFGNGSDYRNPVVAEAMKGLRFVERFGLGIGRMRRAMADNGNPPPEFGFEPGSVLVTLRRREGPVANR